MVSSGSPYMKIVNGDSGYVLEDVPHLTDYISDLPVIPTTIPLPFCSSIFFFFFFCFCIHALFHENHCTGK